MAERDDGRLRRVAEEALRRIQALYQIEADITGRAAAERQTERLARSQPLLDDLKTWMEAQRRGPRARRRSARLCSTPWVAGRR